MKISAFQIMDEESQSFLTTRYSELVQQFSLNTILISHKPSLVGVLHGSYLVIKFIKARSWHEYLKLIWNHSRVTKEVKGTEILEDLGLNVPVIHQVGLIYLMDDRLLYCKYNQIYC